MRTSTNAESIIRNEWFSEHEATYTENGDFKVLTWKREGTRCYYIRYVFDGSRMYVTGDLGEALFCFTELAEVHTFSDYDLGYFEEKLRAYHEDRRSFNSDVAVSRLREWVNDLKKYGTNYDHDEMKDLFEQARGCSSRSEWAHIINSHDWISDLDIDHWEWTYSSGDEMPMRLQSYLIGLKMASEQLRIAATQEPVTV
jgi:hypothetical protein